MNKDAIFVLQRVAQWCLDLERKLTDSNPVIHQLARERLRDNRSFEHVDVRRQQFLRLVVRGVRDPRFLARRVGGLCLMLRGLLDQIRQMETCKFEKLILIRIYLWLSRIL